MLSKLILGKAPFCGGVEEGVPTGLLPCLPEVKLLPEVLDVREGIGGVLLGDKLLSG